MPSSASSAASALLVSCHCDRRLRSRSCSCLRRKRGTASVRGTVGKHVGKWSQEDRRGGRRREGRKEQAGHAQDSPAKSIRDALIVERGLCVRTHGIACLRRRLWLAYCFCGYCGGGRRLRQTQQTKGYRESVQSQEISEKQAEERERDWPTMIARRRATRATSDERDSKTGIKGSLRE